MEGEEGRQARRTTPSFLEQFLRFVLSVATADLDVLGKRMCWFVFKR